MVAAPRQAGIHRTLGSVRRTGRSLPAMRQPGGVVADCGRLALPGLRPATARPGDSRERETHEAAVQGGCGPAIRADTWLPGCINYMFLH